MDTRNRTNFIISVWTLRDWRAPHVVKRGNEPQKKNKTQKGTKMRIFTFFTSSIFDKREKSVGGTLTAGVTVGGALRAGAVGGAVSPAAVGSVSEKLYLKCTQNRVGSAA